MTWGGHQAAAMKPENTYVWFHGREEPRREKWRRRYTQLQAISTMEAGEEEFWVQKKTLQKQKSQSWIKCILVSWMKISASNSPSLLSIPNFTETDKEEEGDVAEEGPREEGPRKGPELAQPLRTSALTS